MLVNPDLVMAAPTMVSHWQKNVPDFINGLMHGLVGSHHQSEGLEDCLQGGEMIAYEITKGIRNIQNNGKWGDIGAALEFSVLVMQLPSALSHCPRLAAELSAIEAWSQVFFHPALLHE